MAAATAVVSRRGNDQFRGLFSDTWDVSCTLDSASIATTATATDTVAVPGVALGDMVIGMSVGVSEAGLVRRAYISAANVVSIRVQNESGSTVDLASCKIRLAVVRLT